MAQNRLQIIVTFIFGLLLSGCFEDPKIVQDKVNQLERVRAELEQKKELYDIKYAEQKAENDKFISYMEGQAGLVKGCEILIDICPKSIKSNGIKAIEDGYGGGLSYSFWIIVVCKIAALSFIVGGVAAGVFVAYEVASKKFGLRKIMESLRAAEQVQKEIQHADAKLAASQAALEKAETEIKEQTTLLHKLKNDETIIHNGIKAATTELKKLEAALAEKRETKRMLDECF